MYFTFVIKQEEPCEGRLSSTVPWEREGEIPSRDPTVVDGIERCSLKLLFRRTRPASPDKSATASNAGR